VNAKLTCRDMQPDACQCQSDVPLSLTRPLLYFIYTPHIGYTMVAPIHYVIIYSVVVLHVERVEVGQARLLLKLAAVPAVYRVTSNNAVDAPAFVYRTASIVHTTPFNLQVHLPNPHSCPLAVIMSHAQQVST
jgi:hypothetical protein